jgi:HK97 family phage portal protein
MGVVSRIARVFTGPSPGEMVSAVMREEPEPLEGTRMDLFNSIIPNWYAENGLTDSMWTPGNAALAERVWVANRCLQLNAQQIATMPVQFHAPESTVTPAWVSNPDPHWYPNGIADALFAIVEQVYGWGFSCQYVTDFYADGYPRSWVVLDSSVVQIRVVDGAREYKLGEQVLDPRRVVQIDRNPGARVHGTSALRSYAQNAWGLLAAGNQSMVVNQGGIPRFYLKAERKLTREQAEELQTQWMARTSSRNGAPPVLPPEITPTEMSFDPADMALLETQEFNARAIASAFGVPAMLLNMPVTGGLTYQNPAALGEMWWRFELRPLATRIANAWSAQMLPRGQFISFDAADTILPVDVGDNEDLGLLASRLGLAVQYGIITPDEARRKLVLAGLDLGDDAGDGLVSQVADASPTQQRAKLTAIGGNP